MRRHALAVTVATALTALSASLLPVTPTQAASSARPTTPPRVVTKFAVATSAYGTRVQGGAVPARSDTTAFEVIGCTNVVGKKKTNYEAEVTIPGLGVADGVRTEVWTEKTGSTVSSFSMHKIARVVIGEGSPAGSLEIRGLESLSHAFNRAGRFGTDIENSIAKIVYHPPTGAPQELDIPAPNQTLTIPGLAKVSLGKVREIVEKSRAFASANVVDITVIPSDTRVRVAQTLAKINAGIRRGVFTGFSTGVEARALADNAKIGRTPLLIHPCQGTQGQEVGKDVAGVNLADQVVARGVTTDQTSTNNPARAEGQQIGKVARAILGGENGLDIRGVRGVVNVVRTKDGVTANSDGTHVLEIVAGGESYSLPKFGTLEIPGLAKLEDNVEVKTRNGLKVIALRVTLLGEDGVVVDLGVAKLQIRPGVKRPNQR